MSTQPLPRRDFLRLSAGMAALPAAAAPSRPPNVVVIFCDDLGYGDLASYGSPLRTPNLDRLAAEGMRFTDCLSANPVCSPSRAALMTGRYPTRVGVPRVLFPYDKDGLPDSETTIAQTLKPLNYKTMCVGKWHLGHLPPYLPIKRGFDEYFGIPYSNDMNPPVLLHNTDVVEQRATLETLTERYTQRAVQFIERSKDSPFFLYMPHTMPHIPLAASKRFRGKTPHGLYGDVIAEIDWSVGEVLGTVKRLGLDNNTLVLFSSDNGPWFEGSPGRLRGRKGMTWEGGVRVPFLARFPGRIPAGKVSDATISLMDVAPTVAKLAGAAAPAPDKAYDGIDMWPLLTGAQPKLDRDLILYFDNVHVQCARLGKWKLHVGRYNSVTYSPNPPEGRHNLPLNQPELYNLSTDPDESYDVAAEHPDVARKMNARIEEMLAGFPPDVRTAWAQTKSRKNAETRTGQVSRVPGAAMPDRKKK